MKATLYLVLGQSVCWLSYCLWSPIFFILFSLPTRDWCSCISCFFYNDNFYHSELSWFRFFRLFHELNFIRIARGLLDNFHLVRIDHHVVNDLNFVRVSSKSSSVVRLGLFKTDDIAKIRLGNDSERAGWSLAVHGNKMRVKYSNFFVWFTREVYHRRIWADFILDFLVKHVRDCWGRWHNCLNATWGGRIWFWMNRSFLDNLTFTVIFISDFHIAFVRRQSLNTGKRNFIFLHPPVYRLRSRTTRRKFLSWSIFQDLINKKEKIPRRLTNLIRAPESFTHLKYGRVLVLWSL